MPESSFRLACLTQVCFRTRFPCYFNSVLPRRVRYNFYRDTTAFEKQAVVKLVSVAPYRGHSTTATPISPESYHSTISLNTRVETYYSLETIGNSTGKTLRPEATQKNKPSKNRLAVMSSFSSGSKRNTPKTNGNADQGVEMEIEKVDLKEAAPHVKEISTEEVPKLERQLTSNFDKEVDFSDSELNDLDTLERDNIVSHVEDPEPQGEESMENILVGDSEKKTLREMNLNLYTGEATDIGGGHENQDKAMCFRAGKNDEHLVMAVFDGHGRELGELAATIARDFMKKELKKTEVLKRIQDNPTSTLEEIFLEAHLRIKTKFKEQVQKIGSWTVVEADEGYLIKRQKVLRKSPTPSVQDTYHIAETNVHGGTTATVVIILNNRRLIVANVGDSTALFGGIDESDNAVFKELSAEHSPESIDEYLRVYESISTTIPTLSGSNSSVLAKGTVTSTSQILRFVYDVIDRYPSTTPKHSCPPIFFVNDLAANGEKQNNGSIQVRRSPNGGFYYKNVRSEWATLVTTPPTARFQDALAFTRSLGDLHLHVYGVTHVPEVREYDLSLLHGSLGRKETSSVILVCTDGVWDNWRYSDIIRKVMSSSLIEKSVMERSSQGLTDELMRENIRLAKTHFGNQADNMTGIVCLVHNSNTDDSK